MTITRPDHRRTGRERADLAIGVRGDHPRPEVGAARAGLGAASSEDRGARRRDCLCADPGAGRSSCSRRVFYGWARNKCRYGAPGLEGPLEAADPEGRRPRRSVRDVDASSIYKTARMAYRPKGGAAGWRGRGASTGSGDWSPSAVGERC